MDEILQQIKQDIKTNPIILYMKGTSDMPQCGFSSRVVQILKELKVEFAVRNVLEDDTLRQGIKQYSNWPTLPQLYVNEEFIGGCDIVEELYQNKELHRLLSVK